MFIISLLKKKGKKDDATAMALLRVSARTSARTVCTCTHMHIPYTKHAHPACMPIEGGVKVTHQVTVIPRPSTSFMSRATLWLYHGYCCSYEIAQRGPCSEAITNKIKRPFIRSFQRHPYTICNNPPIP